MARQAKKQTEQPKAEQIGKDPVNGRFLPGNRFWEQRSSHGGLKKSWKTAFSDSKFFVGVPKQKKGGGGMIKPIQGIYRRLAKNKKIRLEVSFERQTKYSPKWDYQKIAEKVFKQQFNDAFRCRLGKQVARLKKI